MTMTIGTVMDFKKNGEYCDCGARAESWDQSGRPMCESCALERMAALLRCGIPVTLAVPGKPDWVIVPANEHRHTN